MKIASYNLHQYFELNRLNTLCNIADKIVELDLDIIGLQEVAEFEYDFSSEKATNTAKLLQHILKTKHNVEYCLSLNMFKHGFKYNIEGLAILSKYQFTDEQNILVSNTTDIYNYHRREIQVNTINYQGKELTIVNGHYTWDNEVEMFAEQYARLIPHLQSKNCILTGDFNNDPKSENYKLLTSNFTDLCLPVNSNHPTFSYNSSKRRIDYIFTNVKHKLIDHSIHFTDPMYSDHYLIAVEVDIEAE